MSKWKKTPLGSIGEAFIGLTYKPEDISSNGIIVLRSGNIQHNEIDLHEIIRVNKDIKNKLIIRNNDILICSRNGSSNLVGKSALITDILEQMTFGAFMMVYRSHYNKYLHHFMQSPYFKRQLNRSATTTINQITKSMLDKIVVSLPPLEEQHKIASILDTVSKTLKLRKQQLNELDLLVKSKFINMFGEDGKTVPLSKYVWFQEGPGVRSIDFTTTGTILLTGSNINNNKITFGHKSDRFISNELASSRYSHFICDKGDILVVSSAIDPVKFDKKVVIISDDKKYCLNTGIIRFKPDERYLSKTYFSEFLKTDYFKHQVINKMRGIAQMHFGPSHLKEMTILLPSSKKKQEQFNDFIKHIDELKSEVQKSIDQLQTLFDSLMQQYFE